VVYFANSERPGYLAGGGPTILGVFSDQAQAQTAIDNSGLVGEHNREEYIIAQVPVGTLLNN